MFCRERFLPRMKSWRLRSQFFQTGLPPNQLGAGGPVVRAVRGGPLSAGRRSFRGLASGRDSPTADPPGAPGVQTDPAAATTTTTTESIF